MESREREQWAREGFYSPRRRDLKVIRIAIARKRIAEMMNDEIYGDLGFFRRIVARLALRLSHPIHGGFFRRAKDSFTRWYAWNVAAPDRASGAPGRDYLCSLMVQDCEDAGVDLKGDIQTTYFNRNNF